MAASAAGGAAQDNSCTRGDLALVIKDEVMDEDDVMHQSPERRKNRKLKVVVPIQPRNANGTFAK